MSEAKLITLDPGHFHAALVLKEMYPEISRRVSVYAPVGLELADYLARIARFNLRDANPTAWELDLHCSPDFLERMLRERPGNVVVISGRNRGKIGRIKASVEAGLNVLADKPWILASADLAALKSALETAERSRLAAYDVMTERFEITSLLHRELVNHPGVFGELLPGTERQPGIAARSVHNIMKLVAGEPIRRPAWYFDVAQQGEGLSDVGTHIVDLVQWTAFPDQAIHYESDIRILDAARWPTVIDAANFQRVTGETGFPPYLAGRIVSGRLEYDCNNHVHYTLRGIHVKLDILWDWEAAPGAGDSYEAVFRGSKSTVEVRQGPAGNHRPELYVVPNSADTRAEVFTELCAKLAALQERYPGVAMQESGGEARVVIPDRYRVGHEAHFAQVAGRFFEYMKSPESIPAWETPNMLAKYYVSTRGVELARRQAAQTGGN